MPGRTFRSTRQRFFSTTALLHHRPGIPQSHRAIEYIHLDRRLPIDVPNHFNSLRTFFGYREIRITYRKTRCGYPKLCESINPLGKLAWLNSSGAKSENSPALWQSKGVVLKDVIFLTPDLPYLRESQNRPSPIPIHDKTPRPIMTTRRLHPGRGVSHFVNSQSTLVHQFT